MYRTGDHLVDARIGRRAVYAKRAVGQASGVTRVGLALWCVDGRQVRERLAVVVELGLLLGGGVGDAVGAGEKPVHVVKAVVLGVDHDDVSYLRQVGFDPRRLPGLAGAAGKRGGQHRDA